MKGTSVVVLWWAQVPSINAPWCPQPPVIPILVNNGFAPQGCKRFLFQLYGPLRASYADISGFILDARIRLIVSLTCGMSLSHNWRGNLLSVVASTAMKASLNICIAHLAAFTWWLWGSTSCNLHSFSVRFFWYSLSLDCPSHSIWV